MGADPDGDRGLRHSAPTYFSRDTRDLRHDGHRGLASFASTSIRALSRPRRKAGGKARVWAIELGGPFARSRRFCGLAANMRIVFLGDVVGRSGRTALIGLLPRLRERYGAHFVVVNGENAAGGFGISEQILTELLDAGADVVTTGNHVWDQRETLIFIERHERLLRPVNYPKGSPGRGAGL